MSVTLQQIIRLKIHALFFITFVLLVVGCGGGRSAETVTTPEMTAAAGGMALPGGTITETVASNSNITDVLTTTTTAVTALQPGQQVRPLTTAVRLYVDASHQAAVMSQYDGEAVFTLLEPSGDYTSYPVAAEGEAWYRVRTADGLVGWTPAAMLTALP